VRLADEVHHIVPIESVSDVKSMEMLAFDDTNLMSVCRECHHAIHNEMQSHTKESVRKNSERKTKLFFERFLKK
jgi:5-methylcytosine-specific restriction protein A